MTGVDPQAFRFAMKQIDDGNVFEQFGLQFLAGVLGYQFVPVGGLHDRGIDGMEHTFCREGFTRAIYQLSIDQNPSRKIRASLEKLARNKIDCSQFYYVTNLQVANKDQLIDELFAEYSIAIQIFDEQWLGLNVNHSEATVRAYLIFVDSYLHRFAKPGAAFEIANFEGDPRVYSFLRQQWEEHQGKDNLDQILVDSLILYALGGTDPEKAILRTRAEILDRIRELVRFDPRLLHEKIDERLEVLSTKPRRINRHQQSDPHVDAYCLRYEERVRIQEQNLRDAALYDAFKADTLKDLAKYIADLGIDPGVGFSLVEKVLHDLFHQQGLEFSEFVLHNSSEQVMQKSLQVVVEKVVTARGVPNRDFFIAALLMTLRNMVYNGSQAQKGFLNRLAHTYSMMFLLQCEPQLAKYFAALASRLCVYVDASIIIPALSEWHLSPHNRRYHNLLVGARNAGVTLRINEAILGELSAHFSMIMNVYEQLYEGNEDLYDSEENILYIDQIMIRAFFYARLRNPGVSFQQFIDAFVDPRLRSVREDIIEWLRSEYGIEYVSNEAAGIKLDSKDVGHLGSELAKYKGGDGSERKARTDAEVILSIYKLRETNNEASLGGIFGYQTWWLSSDVTTHRSALRVFGKEYAQSCYMRADFLYNYIALAPSRTEADQAFSEMFPTLVGVNISFRVPEEVSKAVHEFVERHKEMNRGRLKATLRDLSDRLKSDPNAWTRKKVAHFLDERRKELARPPGDNLQEG